MVMLFYQLLQTFFSKQISCHFV